MIKSIMLNWAKTPTEFIGYYINCVCIYRFLFGHKITPQLQTITKWMDE